MTLADWASIGDIASGASGFIIVVVAAIGGGLGLSDWRAKQQRQRKLAEEEALDIRLNRQRVLNGWTRGGVQIYGVRIIKESDEIGRALQGLTDGTPCESLRSNANRAHSLRQLIQEVGHIARPPAAAEYEAIEHARKEQDREHGA